jgi:four helix bundle protein
MIDHHRLEVYRTARAFNRLLEGWIAGWPAGRADLVDQARRSSTSCMLNIAEGSGEFAPSEKIRFYRMARRSANETSAAIDALEDSRIATAEQAREAQAALTHIVAMLVRLIQRLEQRTTTPVAPARPRAPNLPPAP